MIIKGCSRGSPKQLAYHLQRVDTNERVSILEIQHPVADLEDAFFCWQTLSEGSRGKKGLYHANIDPAEQYTMTDDQYMRSVDVLEEELGFQGQSRIVVKHEKHGRAHIHVVWCRMDYDTGTLRSDSQNYLKHEKASMRLELEFGHELVPGKHAKRDREQQPEFPRAEVDHAEWQQAERTGLNAAERKEQITALRAAADNALAFKNALEEAGYVLAKGDKRGMVLVDGEGEVFSLSRHVTDIKWKEFKAFMAPIDQAALPTVEEAKALHKQREEETAVKAEKPAPEVSKFLPAEGPPAAEKTPEPPPSSQFLPKKEEAATFDYSLYAPKAPAPEPAKPAPSRFIAQPEPIQPVAQQPAQPPAADAPIHSPKPEPGWTEVELKSKFTGLQPPEAPPPPKPKEDPELRRLRKAVFKRQQEEYQQFAAANSAAYRAFGTQLDYAMRWKMEDFDQTQAQARQDLVLRQTPKRRTGLRGMLDAIAEKLNPEAADQKAAEQKEDRDTLRLQQITDRIEYMKRLDLDKADQLQALRTRQLQEQAAREKTYNEELDRHLQELLKVREIARDLAAEERQKKEDDAAREASGWAEDFKKEQEYPYDDGPPEKGKG